MSFALVAGGPAGVSQVLLQSGPPGPASEGLQASLWEPEWAGPQSNETSHSGSLVSRVRWVAQCRGLWIDMR